MILLIDIGNSRIKWITVARGKARPAAAAPRPAPGDLPGAAAGWWSKLKRPQRVVAGNAAGAEFAAALTEWCNAQWQLAPEFVTARPNAYGVTNAYMVPERLGPDRWAALIAAHRHCGDAAACIVDAGTALTLDVLAAGGQHKGGLIIPGLEMSRRVLLERTGALLEATASPQSGDIALLARDTRDGIEGGTLYALVAVIDRVMADVGVELGERPRRLITGGNASDLLPLLAGEYHHVPDLVLEGLTIIAEQS